MSRATLRDGLVAALSFALVACSMVSGDFRPKGPVELPYVERVAVLYDTQSAALLRFEAKEIGTLEMQGNGFAEEGELETKAVKVAARNGGTHIVLVEKGKRTPPPTYDANGHEAPGSSLVSLPFAIYRVYRVPPARFAELPLELQPRNPERVGSPAAASHWPQKSADMITEGGMHRPRGQVAPTSQSSEMEQAPPAGTATTQSPSTHAAPEPHPS
jgi:hypothetical protein